VRQRHTGAPWNDRDPVPGGGAHGLGDFGPVGRTQGESRRPAGYDVSGGVEGTGRIEAQCCVQAGHGAAG